MLLSWGFHGFHEGTTTPPEARGPIANRDGRGRQRIQSLYAFANLAASGSPCTLLPIIAAYVGGEGVGAVWGGWAAGVTVSHFWRLSLCNLYHLVKAMFARESSRRAGSEAQGESRERVKLI